MTATPGADLDRFVARLLTAGTYLSVAILAIGIVLMLGNGISPVDTGAAPFRAEEIPRAVARLEPDGFLWLGLVAVLATPATRVLASLVGYVREGDRRMAIIAVGILAVIATGVLIAVVTGG